MKLMPAGAADRADIEHLLDAAFGADRKAKTAYRLREGTLPIRELSFVGREPDGRLVGSIQCWPIELWDGSAAGLPLTLLGPVAVSPELQRTGLGKQLMAESLRVADSADFGAMLLIGDVEYYGKFGFTAEPTGDWKVPGPVDRHRLLARIPEGMALPKRGILQPRPPARSLAA